MIDALAAAQGCLGPWTAILFVAGALYASFTLGTTGGPNHGEHPLTVTVLHMILFFWLARGWARGPWWGYLGLLTATLLFAGWGIGLAFVREPWKRRAGRAALLALHAGLFAIAAFSGPG
ncbi:MAG TPA: hypothetical protein VF950_12215 [Planctomycetota bacterium]